MQAVLEGRTHQETAQLFGVARGTVTRWMGLYRERGEVGLNARTKVRSSHPALSTEEAALVVELVSRHSPDQSGLPFFLWTREAVGDLVRRRLGLKLSQWTVGRFSRHGDLLPRGSPAGLTKGKKGKTPVVGATGQRRFLLVQS